MGLGLLPKIGDCYRAHYEDDGAEIVPAIFLATTWGHRFDSTWDDDVWQVEIGGLPLVAEPGTRGRWVMCFDQIPADRVRLVYAGSGSDKLGVKNSADERKFLNILCGGPSPPPTYCG